MNTPVLHPFTGHYLVQYTHPAAAGENPQMLAELLERIGRNCVAAGAILIGHIKAFATQPGGGYLTASVTSTEAPAQVEASELQADWQLKVYLAVLVYGLEREQVAHIVTQTWQELAGEGLLFSVRLQAAPHFDKALKEQP